MNDVTTVEDFSREKVELIKNTVAKGATDLELQLFFHACKRTGLDPLMKQIYAIKRWNGKENRHEMAFQTGIDGYRLIADRTGCYAGSSDAEYTLNLETGFPDVAKVTVTKLVGGMPCQFTSSARWNEYVQTTKDGQPTSMWRKMPFLMLAKCAEALALRKAFPAELSGVCTHEEMTQADYPTKQQLYTNQKAETARKIAELRQEPPAPSEDQPDRPPLEDPAQSEGAGPHEPTLNASNVCQQFVLCESIAEWSQVANAWQDESHLHSDEDRARVKKAADLSKKNLGRK